MGYCWTSSFVPVSPAPQEQMKKSNNSPGTRTHSRRNSSIRPFNSIQVDEATRSHSRKNSRVADSHESRSRKTSEAEGEDHLKVLSMVQQRRASMVSCHQEMGAMLEVVGSRSRRGSGVSQEHLLSVDPTAIERRMSVASGNHS